MEILRWVLIALASASAAFAGGAEIPFPVRKSTTASRDGASYIVEGRQRIGRGVTITVKQNTRIVGRDNAVLEIAGTLIIEGQPHQEVVMENVRLEPARTFDGIRIEWARMLSGDIRNKKGTPTSGIMTIDSSTIMGFVNLTFSSGELRIENAEFRSHMRVQGKPALDSNYAYAPFALKIMNCNGGLSEKYSLVSGFNAGLTVARAKHVLLRANWLVGNNAYEFRDCNKVMFDGNTVVRSMARFSQSEPGGFKKTRVTKCDFHSTVLELYSPKAEKPDRVLVDKCWFNGITDPEKVFEKYLIDARRNPKSNAYARLQKLHKRPLGIGGRPLVIKGESQD